MNRDNIYHHYVEVLGDDPSYIERRMFGSLAIYHCGRLKFVLADSETPWNGVLVATERDQHEALINEFPALVPHPVLGKWLYLAGETENFEATARKLVLVASRDDLRIGVVPKPKKKKNRKKKLHAVRSRSRS